MNRTARFRRKPTRTLSRVELEAKAARAAKAHKVQLALGTLIIGVGALASIVMAMRRQIPVPVCVGVILFFVLRVVFLKWELRRQANAPEGAP